MASASAPGYAEPAPVVGLRPWFFWPLSRWKWLNEPIRAERLAALRIGIAFFLLLDLVTTQWPMAAGLYSRDGIRPIKAFAGRFGWSTKTPATIDPETDPPFRWSLLEKYDSPGAVYFFMTLWTVAALSMLVGFFTRLSVVATWVLNVSFLNCNDTVDNAGDTVRQLALFYLMISPCGAAWSFDSWFRRNYRWVSSLPVGQGFLGLGIAPRRRPEPYRGPIFIHPWSVRLVFVQMIVIYLFNGIAKGVGETWHNGTSLYHVLCDLSLARWSYAMLPTPMWMIKILTWMVLWWEMLFFPMMLVPWKWIADQVAKIRWGGLHNLDILFRWNREIMLIFGALFHVGIWLTMEIGFFAPYMLCLYLTLLPWEWWFDRKPAPLEEGRDVESVDELPQQNEDAARFQPAAPVVSPAEGDAYYRTSEP